MKTSQKQLVEALADLIPQDAQAKVSEVVTTFFESAFAELEEEYNQKLGDGFAKAHAKVEEAEKIGHEGYVEAWDIISDLRQRLNTQKIELIKQRDEGFEEAYSMLQEERAKNDSLEGMLYEEYDNRFNSSKKFMVDKIDDFLQQQKDKLKESVRREVMNDPTTLEHKVAFNKILEVASDYLSDEDMMFATSTKVDKLQKDVDGTKAQIKILEAKNMRLSTENTRLNESVRKTEEILNEQSNILTKKVRAEKAKKVEGRGEVEPKKDRQKVITEWQADETVADKAKSTVITEAGDDISEEQRKAWQYLAEYTSDEQG